MRACDADAAVKFEIIRLTSKTLLWSPYIVPKFNTELTNNKDFPCISRNAKLSFRWGISPEFLKGFEEGGKNKLKETNTLEAQRGNTLWDRIKPSTSGRLTNHLNLPVRGN